MVNWEEGHFLPLGMGPYNGPKIVRLTALQMNEVLCPQASLTNQHASMAFGFNFFMENETPLGSHCF